MYSDRITRPPNDQRKTRNRFVRCELHGCNVVVGLPPGCAFSTPNPLEAIRELVERAWRQRASDEFTDANDLFDVVDTCSVCVDRHAGNRIIQGLRHELTRVPTDTTNT